MSYTSARLGFLPELRWGARWVVQCGTCRRCFDLPAALAQELDLPAPTHAFSARGVATVTEAVAMGARRRRAVVGVGPRSTAVGDDSGAVLAARPLDAGGGDA